MKKLSIFLIIALATILSSTSMAQSEFSSSLICVGVVTKDIQKSLDFYLNVI